MVALIIVRRNASETFYHLQATWALKLGGDLTVTWDRRISDRRRYEDSIPVDRCVGERREVEAEWPDSLNDARRAERRQQPELRMPERRQAERRRRAPDTWGTLGFLVVHDEEGSR